MSDQTTAIVDGPESADSSMTTVVVDTSDHTAVETADYQITLHPAFASACTVTPAGGAPRDLFRQAPGTVVDCKAKGHPKKHVLKLKGKTNGRDITITIEDPEHSIHLLRLELYKPGRKPGDPVEVGDVFTVENDAKTCPPMCDI
jgi:hypothetical protein